MPDLPCDALIIGSGQAGNPLAKALAEAGQTVILVEEAELGGSCLNYGCIPAKMLVASAERAQLVRTAGELGIEVNEKAVRVNMAAVQARKRALQARSRQNLARSLAPTHPGLRVLRGRAAFVGERRVRVSAEGRADQLISARRVFINVGTRPAVPGLPGLAEAGYLTTNELLEIEEVPQRLLIVGGGYIGLEFGQLFRRLGSEVIILDTGARVLEREDDDVCAALQAGLEAEGVEFVLSGQARRVSRDAATGRYTLTVDVPGGERRLHGSHLLIATGRQPNTDALDLAATGLQTDEKGFIPVNSRLETRVPGIYALGDVHGGPQFTHLSYDDFRVIRANLLENGPRRSARQRPLPYCVFTDPGLGRVGLSEAQATEKKLKFRVAKVPVAHLSRAQQTGQTTGFWKILVGPDDRLLGAAIVGPAAGEIMTIIQVAMLGRLRYQQLAELVIAHPVWAEGLNVAFRSMR